MREMLLLIAVLITIFGCVVIATPANSNGYVDSSYQESDKILLILRGLAVYGHNYEMEIDYLEFRDQQALELFILEFKEILDGLEYPLELLPDIMEAKASIGLIEIRPDEISIGPVAIRDNNVVIDVDDDVAIDLGFVVLHKDDTWQIILLALLLFIAAYMLKLEVDHFYFKRQERYKKRLM